METPAGKEASHLEKKSPAAAVRPLLSITGLGKRYPGVVALDNVSLELPPGEIHALVGENGAGKSTLIKILSGITHANGGEIRLEGMPLELRQPHQARQAGIATVHQHSHLIPYLSLAENFALRQGYPRAAGGIIDWPKMRAQARGSLAELAPGLDVRQAAERCSGVHQQLAEIAFALSSRPRLLILDEPTAILPRHETELLFEKIRQAAAEGTGVLFVSHRLEEVFHLCRRVTVLRDGRMAAVKEVARTSAAEIIQAMVGRAVSFARDPSSAPGQAVRLQIEGLGQSEKLRGITLNLREGEIYGIYGLVGSGQSELCQTLFGLSRAEAGQVTLEGAAEITNRSPRRRIGQGLAYVPADRLSQGVFYQMSVGENLSMADLRKFSRAGLISGGREDESAQRMIQALRIKTLGPRQSIAELSGGNQQKCLLGRWLLTEPNILILEEPTQGVDVGAKGEIHKLILDLARRGVAILLVSSELPELLALAHRIGVMNRGRLAGEVDPRAAGQDEILKLALPQSAETKNLKETASKTGKSWRERASRLLLQRESILLLVFLGLFSYFLSIPSFRELGNLRDILAENSILLVGALGATVVIIAGGIDVSVGSIFALAAVSAGRLDQLGYSSLTVGAAALLVGALLGGANGLLAVYGRIHPIVITLGTLSVYRGAMVIWTGGYWLDNLGPSIRVFGKYGFNFLPVFVIIALAATLLVHTVLRLSVTGRSFYALGGERLSAAYLGITPRRVWPIAFALSGALAGLAGLLQTGRSGQVQTNWGSGFELQVIAAAVIGGTNIMGGRGSALGTLLGTLLIGIIANYINLKRYDPMWIKVFTGSLILLTMTLDALVRRWVNRKEGPGT